MDSGREESNLLFLPNLCLCGNIHIFVKVLCRFLCADWVLRLASLRPAIMSDCVQTKPAQPLNFTAFGSHSHTLPHFLARCFARRETSKKKRHTHKHSLSTAGLRLLTSVDCGRSSGTEQRRFAEEEEEIFNFETTAPSRRFKQVGAFIFIDAVFAILLRISEVACLASVCETGEYISVLVGYRTFLRCFERRINR